MTVVNSRVSVKIPHSTNIAVTKGMVKCSTNGHIYNAKTIFFLSAISLLHRSMPEVLVRTAKRVSKCLKFLGLHPVSTHKSLAKGYKTSSYLMPDAVNKRIRTCGNVSFNTSRLASSSTPRIFIQ